MRNLARSLYSRASAVPFLRRPLDAIRSHPRVRAFARRHVDLLLADGSTWANVDGALRLLGEGGQPVAFAAWEGDDLTELLYWRPFRRWAERHFSLRAGEGGAAFPSAPVRGLVERYRSGEDAPRPLLKRAIYERDGTHAGGVLAWSADAVAAVLAGAPTVAVRGAGAVDTDLDLAQRIAAELGTSLTIVDAAGLERLNHALR